MANKNAPVGRIVYRAEKGDPWLQIGTLWSSPYDGTFGMSLGNRAFKETPGVTAEEAAELLTSGRGFTNVWMNRPKKAESRNKDGEDLPNPFED
jgi:hypothetical protein